MNLDRSQLNVMLIGADSNAIFDNVNFAGAYVCPWASRFSRESGISVKIHIYSSNQFRTLFVDDSVFEDDVTLVNDQHVCSEYPDVEGFYVEGFTGITSPKEGLRDAHIRGLLGPMDVWLAIGHQSGVPRTESVNYTESDIHEDLTPWLSHQTAISFEEIPAVLRSNFNKDGDKITSLPFQVNSKAFFYHSDQVSASVDATLKDGGAITWDELLAEIERLNSEARDGDLDGTPDGPAFCFPIANAISQARRSMRVQACHGADQYVEQRCVSTRNRHRLNYCWLSHLRSCKCPAPRTCLRSMLAILTFSV